ncbi:superoxide dismutase family protein [Streptomyces sp. PU-14G]|uniref:superoxide dismutase family protein n=1 Tax=Streptomyces sp. PU-14G TaxID=2800808 RepID=UPI0034DE9CE1
MRARMRTAGVGGVAAVTMVTALFAGSEPSSASEVPDLRSAKGLESLRDLPGLGDGVRLENLGDNEGMRIARALQRGEGVGLRDLSLRVGSGTVEIVSSEDRGTGRDVGRDEGPGQGRGDRTGRTDAAEVIDLIDLVDREGGLIRLEGPRKGKKGDEGQGRLTRELRVTDGEGAYRVFRLGGGTDTVAGTADIRNRSVLARYDQFSPANAFVRPDAVTYDRAKVPAGASIGVVRTVTDGATTVRLEVGGLPKNRTYGAHVHTEPCGAKPDEAGPHYQNEKDPVRPSTDPRYANPRNEVWLDFTTDAEGEGKAVSRHDWTFRKGEARSVVLHETGTRTEAGHAGEAGARLACFTVPLNGR